MLKWNIDPKQNSKVTHQKVTQRQRKVLLDAGYTVPQVVRMNKAEATKIISQLIQDWNERELDDEFFDDDPNKWGSD